MGWASACLVPGDGSEPIRPLSWPAAGGCLKPCEHRTSTGRRRVLYRWVGHGSRRPRWRCGNFKAVTRRLPLTKAGGGVNALLLGVQTEYGGIWRVCRLPVAWRLSTSSPTAPSVNIATLGGHAHAWCQATGQNQLGLWPTPDWHQKPCEHKTSTGQLSCKQLSSEWVQFVRSHAVMWITVAILD